MVQIKNDGNQGWNVVNGSHYGTLVIFEWLAMVKLPYFIKVENISLPMVEHSHMTMVNNGWRMVEDGYLEC